MSIWTLTTQMPTHFEKFITSWSLKQHIDFPTHNHVHKRFLLLNLNEEIIPSNIKSEGFISDHCVITSYLKLQHTAIHDSVTLTVRNSHKIDMAALKCDLMASDLLPPEFCLLSRRII